MKKLRLSVLMAIAAFDFASFTSAAPPPAPVYRLEVAGFHQGADYGLVTGMNNLAQAVFIRISFGTRSYWWNGVEEIQLLPTAFNSQASVLDLDDNGVAVGLQVVAGTRRLAMIWEQGVPRDLGTMGGLESSAEAINDHGVVAGWSSVPGGAKHLFTWQEGFTDLGPLPPSSTCCHDIKAINDSGQIVGHPGSQLRGWLFDNGQFIALPDLNGGNDTTPQDINGSGLVVGRSWPHQTDMRPVMWTNAQVQALPMPLTAVGGEARAINDQSEIVGFVTLPDPLVQFRPHAMLWKNGAPYLLSDVVMNLGDWQLRQAEHINDRGQIEVLAYSDTNSWRRVILSPVPEPSAAILAMIALSLAFYWMRR